MAHDDAALDAGQASRCAEAVARLAAGEPLAYVTEYASNTVRIIDTTTEELVGSIPGFNQPTGLACSEDGRYLFVCNFGNNTVAVVSV